MAEDPVTAPGRPTWSVGDSIVAGGTLVLPIGVVVTLLGMILDHSLVAAIGVLAMVLWFPLMLVLSAVVIRPQLARAQRSARDRAGARGVPDVFVEGRLARDDDYTGQIGYVALHRDRIGWHHLWSVDDLVIERADITSVAGVALKPHWVPRIRIAWTRDGVAQARVLVTGADVIGWYTGEPTEIVHRAADAAELPRATARIVEDR